jgi:adenylate kinase family enzyme
MYNVDGESILSTLNDIFYQNRMVVLLLSGWSTSGKDTVASLLQEYYGFQRYAFADVLKEMVAEEFIFPVEWAHSEIGKQKKPLMGRGRTVRELLILRGQGIREERNDPGYFARIVAEKIQQNKNSANFVITDWRLPIELETLETVMQPLKIRIQRSGLFSSPVVDSFTETQLDSFPFDFTLKNPGTTREALLQEMQRTLIPFLEKLTPIQ